MATTTNAEGKQTHAQLEARNDIWKTTCAVIVPSQRFVLMERWDGNLILGLFLRLFPKTKMISGGFVKSTEWEPTFSPHPEIHPIRKGHKALMLHAKHQCNEKHNESKRRAVLLSWLTPCASETTSGILVHWQIWHPSHRRWLGSPKCS